MISDEEAERLIVGAIQACIDEEAPIDITPYTLQPTELPGGRDYANRGHDPDWSVDDWDRLAKAICEQFGLTQRELWVQPRDAPSEQRLLLVKDGQMAIDLGYYDERGMRRLLFLPAAMIVTGGD